jgi:mRNA interferase MazF
VPTFTRGDVVWVPFPFSEDEDYKIRPAVILAQLPRGVRLDYLVCAVTTQRPDDPYLLELRPSDLTSGKISQTCFIRPTYPFTVGERFVKQRLCTLKPERVDSVIKILVRILKP